MNWIIINIMEMKDTLRYQNSKGTESLKEISNWIKSRKTHETKRVFILVNIFLKISEITWGKEQIRLRLPNVFFLDIKMAIGG